MDNKHLRAATKGKPCESRGRKAMGLPRDGDDRQAADSIQQIAMPSFRLGDLF